MTTEFIDDYEVEYTAEPLDGCSLWGAYVSVFAPLTSPMHREHILAKQRVSADKSLATQEQAEAEAKNAVLDIIKTLKSQHGE